LPKAPKEWEPAPNFPSVNTENKPMHITELRLFPERYPDKEHYPFHLEVLHRTTRLTFPSPLTFFAGENGTGKSTLLKAITRKCGIHIWSGIERSRWNRSPYEDELHRYVSVQWSDGVVPGSYVASDIFRNFSQILDQWATADPGVLEYFGGRSLMTQSHGQSLMSFFRARYRIKGLYFLDEPETALSPRTQVELLQLLREASMSGHAQFIIATHSPILLACPGAVIYSFDHAPVKPVEYEDTEHYRIYRDFMEDRSRFLKAV